MKHAHAVLAVFALLPAAVSAQAALPTAQEVPWARVQTHGRQLLKALDALGQPLPADTTRTLRALLDREGKDNAAAQAQKLLDRHCLLAVHINPESRVKAARGPATAELIAGKDHFLLVKVVNDAGVTHALNVQGPGLVEKGAAGPDHWLEATVVTTPPLGKDLGGGLLEYRVLRLRAREAGKREATFQLDVGQGTQDLGFRAEVPILFTVRAAP